MVARSKLVERMPGRTNQMRESAVNTFLFLCLTFKNQEQMQDGLIEYFM